MPITYKGPPPDIAERPPSGFDQVDPELLTALGLDAGGTGGTRTSTPYASPGEPLRFSILGFLLALLSAAGVAAAIALLYNGMSVIMQTQGGFVATGGPYEIVHPAPDWVWLLPASIFAGVVFVALNLFAAQRGWGINLTLFMWMGTFIALGWNFLRLGFNPPPGMEGAWGWIVSGIVFWIMGFAPVLILIRPLRQGYRSLVDRQSSDARRMWRAPQRGDTTPVYVVGQALGALLGVAAGILLFAAICGLDAAFYGTWTSAGATDTLEFSMNSIVTHASDGGAETLGTWTTRSPAEEDQAGAEVPDADAYLTIPNEAMWQLPYAKLTDENTFELIDEEGVVQQEYKRAE